MGHFLLGQLAGMGIGFVVGFFCPGVYRKVKGWLSKEKNAVTGAIKSKL